MKKIIASLSVLALIGAGVAASTSSFFSDTEVSSGNTFAAGSIDLTIDSTGYYNGSPSAMTTWQRKDLSTTDFFFHFLDVKPSDDGQDAISLHTTSNPSWACMQVSLTSDDDLSSVDPELADGDTADVPADLFDGELGSTLQMVLWSDDGDNVIESNEAIITQGPAKTMLANKIALADSAVSNILGLADGSPLVPDTTYFIAKAWCFGTLTLSPVAPGAGNPATDPGFSCDGSVLTNVTQTDGLTADISFTAIQSRNNADFLCDSCESGTASASAVVAFAQGKRKDGTDVLASRSNPSQGLGSPDGSNPTVEGKVVGLGYGGVVTLSFDAPVQNGPGSDDLSFYETTNGRPTYPTETAKVEVSQDGSSWTDLGEITSQNLISTKDLGSLPWIKYVRITDTTVAANNPDGTSDGFDLDAVVGAQSNSCIAQ